MTHSTGSVQAAWQTDYERDLMRTFNVPFAELVRGEGCHVWDSAGNRYLDFLAGIAVNALGHAHPVLTEAIARQAAELVHVSNFFATPPQLQAAALILRLAGGHDGGRVFFANSGTEAMEAAFKLARRTGRPRILAHENSFHGRSMGALALTGKAALRAPFEPMPGGVQHIGDTIAELEAALGPDVAALVVEPIKGEAGVVPLPEGYLRAARELTARHGALLIVDEIQTGAGRTGDWFAFQHQGIVPDAMTLAKGIGGGVPVGALVTFGAASELLQRGQHGSTFGGNPLATAAVVAVLGELERADLVAAAARRGEQLREAVLGIRSPLVRGVRGRGLLLGVALSGPVANTVRDAAFARGLIVNAANDETIRLVPPLTIGEAEIAEFTTLFREALEAAA